MSRKLKTSLSHTHPLAYIQQPDILNEDRSSVIDIVTRILYAALPTIICFELNIINTLINIYFVGNYASAQLFIGIGIGSVITSILGFILMQSMNMGFAAACVNLNGLQNSNKAIGLMYQKALFVNFFLCILITPILYFSDHLLKKIALDQNIVSIAGQYIWGLVPSLYLYCFYDTTRSYLQSQGHLYPPLVIQSFSTLIHIILAWILIKQFQSPLSGAIWTKNLSDGLNFLLLYIYIIKRQPTKQSWIEWSIEAATNWTVFLQIILSIGISTYIQAVAYQLMTIIAAHLSQFQMIETHIIVSNTTLIVYLASLGLSHCIAYSFFSSLRQNKIDLAQKKFFVGIFIMLSFSIVVILELYFHESKWFQLFKTDKNILDNLREIFPIMVLVIIFQSTQICLSAFLRSMDMGQRVLKVYLISFYLIGLGSGSVFAFYYKLNTYGIWLGWLTGLVFALIWFCKILFSIKWQQINSELQLQQEKIKDQIRKSFREQQLNGELLQKTTLEQSQKKKKIKKSSSRLNILQKDVELIELKPKTQQVQISKQNK